MKWALLIKNFYYFFEFLKFSKNKALISAKSISSK